MRVPTAADMAEIEKRPSGATEDRFMKPTTTNHQYNRIRTIDDIAESIPHLPLEDQRKDAVRDFLECWRIELGTSRLINGGC